MSAPPGYFRLRLAQLWHWLFQPLEGAMPRRARTHAQDRGPGSQL